MRKLSAILLLLLVPALARAATYTSGTNGISVTQTNTTVTFTDNHSGGTNAAFLARSITVSSRAASANTCFVDYNDATATTSDIAIAPGEKRVFTRGPGYSPESGWPGLGVICATGQTATFDVTADRFSNPLGFPVQEEQLPRPNFAKDWLGNGHQTIEQWSPNLPSYGWSKGELADWSASSWGPTVGFFAADMTWSANNAGSYPSVTSLFAGARIGGAGKSGVYGQAAGAAFNATGGTDETPGATLIAAYASANPETGKKVYDVVGFWGSASAFNGVVGNDVIGVRAIASGSASGTVAGKAMAVDADTGTSCDLPNSFTCAAFASGNIYSIYAHGYGRNMFEANGASNYALETKGAGKGILAKGDAGQLQLEKGDGPKPTCDAPHRGSFWYEPGATNVADTLEVCRKDGSNVYAWVSVY